MGVLKFREESGRESNSTEKDFERKRARWARDERAEIFHGAKKKYEYEQEIGREKENWRV